MVSRLFSSLLPVRVTVAYAMALLLIATVLLALGPHVQDSVVAQLSTNLRNLEHGHLGTLLGSAFVTADGPIYILLPGLVCLLAPAELLWCSRSLVQAFVLGHIGATLVVAVGLAAAMKFGWLPTSIAGATDVGLSYGAVAVLGTLTAALPPRFRAAWIGWWVAVALAIVASGADFTAAGHTVALMLGMLLSTQFRSPARWTAARLALLAGGIGFGFLMIVGVLLPAAPVAGAAGVVVSSVFLGAARLWSSSRNGTGRSQSNAAASPEVAPSAAGP